MKLYDHVTRHPRQYNGIAYKLIIPRYYCANDACCQKVARIIPDIILPNKHYEANVIEDAVDEAVSPGDPEMFDYPCDDTVRNWKDWIAENKTQIDGALRLIGSQHPGVGLPLLDTRVSLLDHLRKNLIGWLSEVTRLLWNFCVPPLNARQIHERSGSMTVPLFFHGVTASGQISFISKEDINNDSIIRRRERDDGCPQVGDNSSSLRSESG